MVTIVRTADLPAPPERVWAVATPLERWPEWLSLHVRWPDEPPAEVAKGTSFREVVSLLGLPVPVTWTVTEASAPAVFAMSGEAIAGVRVAVSFVMGPVDSGTSMTMTAELTGALVAGSLQSTVQKFADSQLSASITALTALLA